MRRLIPALIIVLYTASVVGLTIDATRQVLFRPFAFLALGVGVLLISAIGGADCGLRSRSIWPA